MTLAGRFDLSMPVLLLRIGRYPLHAGSVEIARSLGAVGVSVTAVTEDRFTPVAASRHLHRRVVWPTTGQEDEAELVHGIAEIVGTFDAAPMVVCTDDESAVLVAEHAGRFAQGVRIPRVAPYLPRTLADKEQLHRLCARLGMPTAEARFPRTFAEVAEFARGAAFPVMVKNAGAFTRLRAPAVRKSVLLRGPDDLLAAARQWREPFRVVLQEYLPGEDSEDWVFHGYFGEGSAALATFTGLKIRSWPPEAGVTTYGRVVDNPPLLQQATGFCRAIGYRGIVDQDWRFDRRDGSYKLLDCNPRVGAQFGLFENDAGIDVVRAMHLDLSGRPVPPGIQVSGKGYRIEHLDLGAARAAAGRSVARCTPQGLDESTRPDRAWWSATDPLPWVVMLARVAAPGLAWAVSSVRQSVRGPVAAAAAPRRAIRRTSGARAARARAARARVPLPSAPIGPWLPHRLRGALGRCAARSEDPGGQRPADAAAVEVGAVDEPEDGSEAGR